jgi:hypothetical protein
MSTISASVMIKTKHRQVFGDGRGDKEGRQEYIWGWSCEGARGAALNGKYSSLQAPQFALQQLPSRTI